MLSKHSYLIRRFFRSAYVLNDVFSLIPLKHKHVDAVIEGVNPVHYIASNQDVYKNYQVKPDYKDGGFLVTILGKDSNKLK